VAQIQARAPEILTFSSAEDDVAFEERREFFRRVVDQPESYGSTTFARKADCHDLLVSAEIFCRIACGVPFRRQQRQIVTDFTSGKPASASVWTFG